MGLHEPRGDGQRPWEWICSEKPVEVRFLKNVIFSMIQHDQERRKQRLERKGREDERERSIGEVEGEAGSILSP